jgi:hypothetical protein
MHDLGHCFTEDTVNRTSTGIKQSEKEMGFHDA